MIVLALDLSTKTGWAVLKDAKLVKYGLIVTSVSAFPLAYPLNLCAAAQSIAIDIAKIVGEYRDLAVGDRFEVAIEDTNLGPDSQRYAQKILEFIHCCVISKLLDLKIRPVFVNSSDWRKNSGVVMSEQDRNKNSQLVDAKEQQKQATINSVKTMIDRKYNGLVSTCKTKKDLRALTSKMTKERKDLETYFLKGLRAPPGKITYKHLSVDRVNKLFGKRFALSDNDICDAIMIGYSRFAGMMKPKEEPKDGIGNEPKREETGTEGSREEGSGTNS